MRALRWGASVTSGESGPVECPESPREHTEFQARLGTSGGCRTLPPRFDAPKTTTQSPETEEGLKRCKSTGAQGGSGATSESDAATEHQCKSADAQGGSIVGSAPAKPHKRGSAEPK